MPPSTSLPAPAKRARVLSGWTLLALSGALSLVSGPAAAQFQVNSRSRLPYPTEKIGAIAQQVRPDGWVVFKPTLQTKPQDVARTHKEAFGLGRADELRLTESATDELRLTRYRYTQYHGQWPVEGADFSVYAQADKATFATGRVVKSLGAPQAPTVTEQQALATALASVPATRYQWQDPEQEQALRTAERDSSATYRPTGKLLYALTTNNADAVGTVHRLAYCFEIMRLEPSAYEAVYVDALTGKLLRIASLVNYGSCQANQVDTWYNGNRAVYTWWNGYEYLLQDFCRGGYIYVRYAQNNNSAYNSFANGYYIGASGSEAYPWNTNWNWGFEAKSAASTLYGVQAAHWYFQQTFGRNGPANRNRDIRVLVGNFPRSAYYQQHDADYIAIGRWPYEMYRPSMAELDAVAHEYTHGVVNGSARFVSGGEPGALNESFADIFGEMIESYNSSTPDWIAGGRCGLERAFARSVARSSPFLPQPAQVYQDPGAGWDVGGEVHTNGGVQNRWFYLLAVGGTGHNNIAVDGIGEEKASRIAYRNLTRYLGPYSNYANARTGAIQAALDLYGSCSPEVIATTNAWAAVGVGASTSPDCATEISGPAWLCIQDAPNVDHEYHVYAPTAISKTWSWDNPAFGFSQSGANAVLSQIPAYTDGALLSVFIQYANASANTTRSMWVNTYDCYPPDQERTAAGPALTSPASARKPAAAGTLLTSQASARKPSVTVYPNPAASSMTLDLGVPAATATTVRLQDLLGRTLRTQHLVRGQRTVVLDVTALPVGSFTLAVTTATGTTTTRVLISR